MQIETHLRAQHLLRIQRLVRLVHDVPGGSERFVKFVQRRDAQAAVEAPAERRAVGSGEQDAEVVAQLAAASILERVVR